MTTFRAAKDPEAVLDYVFDWRTNERGKKPWLQVGETIVSHSVTADGVTIDAVSATDSAVTAWVSGGQHRTNARLVCEITTSMGRTDQRTAAITVADR
jgi:hypothetical protein